MNLKSQRELFPQNNFYPPLGYYNVKENTNVRQVDFGEKKRNVPRKLIHYQSLGPGSYFNHKKLILPELPNKLNIYAKP